MKATIQDIDQWEYDVERSVVPSVDAERDLPGAINKFIVNLGNFLDQFLIQRSDFVVDFGTINMIKGGW